MFVKNCRLIAAYLVYTHLEEKEIKVHLMLYFFLI